MYWLLIVVLFHADPAVLPDVQIKSYASEKACNDAIVQLGTAIQQAGAMGYESGGLKCEAVSNPLTEKGA